jgi:fluoride exporter
MMRFNLNNLGYLLTIALQKPAIRNPVAVSLGAIAGSLSRYYLSVWLAQRLGYSFPYATFVINLTGSFAMGLLITLVLERTLLISPEVRLLLTAGFLGSYTTFSTYELDTMNLVRESSLEIAIAYWLGSAIFGFLSLYLGIIVARLIG